jgi:hypothetical protein
LGLTPGVEWMDLYFLYFVLFSFILVALILFILFFTDELKQIKGHFKWRQYIVYLLGSFLILGSISFSYFIYLHGPFWLALLAFVAFNATAVYFLYRASTIVKEIK